MLKLRHIVALQGPSTRNQNNRTILFKTVYEYQRLYQGHSLPVGLIFKNPVRYDCKIRYLNPFRYQMSMSTFHVTTYLKTRSSCQAEIGRGGGG
jgi:hypothetical protein